MLTTRPDRFDRRCRTCYWAILALGCSILVLFPVWRGQFYSLINTPGQEGSWTQSGSFGLSGVTAHTNQAPLWAPPQARFGATSVRLPWQSVQSHSTIEIELFAEATLLAALVAGCGIVLRVSYGLAFRPPDHFVRLAWSMAAGLLLTGSVVWLTLLLTMAWMLEHYENWVIAAMLAGGPLGLWYGYASRRSATSELDDNEHLGEHAPSGIPSDHQ